MKNTGKRLAVWGTALNLCSLAGSAASVYGMIKSFSELGSGGETRLEVLAPYISIALYATAAALRWHLSEAYCF